MKNKRFTIRLSSIVFLVGILMAACVPQAPALPPEEIISRSETAMKQAAAYEMTIKMKITVSGLTMDMNMSGAYQAPEKVYLKMEIPMTGEIEMYIPDKNTIYAKGATLGNNWTKMDASELGDTSANTGMLQSPGKFVDFAEGVSLAGVEKVGDVTCYHISATISADKMMEVLGSLAEMGLGMSIQDMPVEMWIGADDFYIRKVSLKMEMSISGQKASYDMTFDIFNYNLQYSFPTP